MESRPFGYYPRLAEDMLVALGDGRCAVDEVTGDLSKCDVGLYTICVAKCPNMGDIVCNYDVEPSVLSPRTASLERKRDAALRQQCWVVPIAQEEKFNRCVPATDQNANSVAYQCCYDKVTTSQWDPGRSAPWGACPGGCCPVTEAGTKSCTGMIRVHEEVNYNTTAGMNGLMANLVSTEATMQRWFGDTKTVAPFVLLFGVGFSMVAATGFVCIMQLLAGCIVWIIAALIFVLWVIISIVCLLKGGSFFGIEIETDTIMSQVAAHTGESHADDMDTMNGYLSTTNSEQEQLVWMYIGHAACLFTLFYLLLVFALADRIQLTIELIKVTAKAIQGTPGTMLIPIIEQIIAAGILIFFLASSALILTSDWNPKADLKEALAETNEDGSSYCPVSICKPDVMNVTVAVEDQSNNETRQSIMLAYQLFGYYWGLYILDAFKSMVVAAAVAEVFWTKRTARERKPTIDGLKYIVKYHLGSACLGALALASIAFVRAMLTYVQAKTAEAQRNNPALKALFCACQCCMCCFNRCMKYLSSNAFIMVAIDGEPFCVMAWRSFTLLLSNSFRVGMAQSLSRITGGLAVLFIASCTTFIAAFCFTNLPMFQFGYVDTSTDPPEWVSDPGSFAIQSSVLPSMLVFMLSMIVAKSFTTVWDIGVSTVLFSFLLDESRAKAGVYQEEDPNYSVTKQYWPELHEYLNAPERQRKSEAELGRDSKLMEDRPPGICLAGCLSGGSGGDMNIALTEVNTHG